MELALTFSFITSRYSVHSAGCPQCCTTKKRVHLTTAGTFATVASARAWADADESEKADKQTKALLTVCKCTNTGSK